MPRTAKCKYCGKPVITTEGYKVVVNGRNIYYCNEQEYRKAIAPSLTRNSVLVICNEILSSPTDGVLCKELNEWLKIADINKILAYLTEYKVYISNQMERKTFSSYYGKVRYFSAIVKNSLSVYKMPQPDIQKDLAEICEVKPYTYSRKRKSLCELAEDLENE